MRKCSSDELRNRCVFGCCCCGCKFALRNVRACVVFNNNNIERLFMVGNINFDKWVCLYVDVGNEEIFVLLKLETRNYNFVHEK